MPGVTVLYSNIRKKSFDKTAGATITALGTQPCLALPCGTRPRELFEQDKQVIEMIQGRRIS
jgi:hypothetical protein